MIEKPVNIAESLFQGRDFSVLKEATEKSNKIPLKKNPRGKHC